MDLKESAILGDQAASHWYYASKANAMLRMVAALKAQSLLDVGAGSGFFSKFLLQHSSAREAWCVDTEYAADTDSVSQGKPLHFRKQVNNVKADLVLLMDVLEHVDDDVGLLRDYIAKVPPGTAFFISVPAFAWLWSKHDDFLEHKRRYTLAQLESVARQAGLTIVSGNYYFLKVLPIAAVTRLLQRLLPPSDNASQLTRHSAFVNSTLKLLCALELPFLKLNRVAGLSVFCLART